jgi:hypothetical protein
MTTREAHVVYYAESFCGLSETYVYRTAQMSFLYRANNNFDARPKHRDAFPTLRRIRRQF